MHLRAPDLSEVLTSRLVRAKLLMFCIFSPVKVEKRNICLMVKSVRERSRKREGARSEGDKKRPISDSAM